MTEGKLLSRRIDADGTVHEVWTFPPVGTFMSIVNPEAPGVVVRCNDAASHAMNRLHLPPSGVILEADTIELDKIDSYWKVRP